MPKPSLPLDVPLMDDDHAHLEAMLVTVASCRDEGLPSLLGEIEAETRAHFAREEQLMEAADVPILSCHKMQHRLFLATFDEARAAAARNDVTELRRFLQVTLPGLFTDHIGSVDRVTASFIVSGRMATAAQ